MATPPFRSSEIANENADISIGSHQNNHFQNSISPDSLEVALNTRVAVEQDKYDSLLSGGVRTVSGYDGHGHKVSTGTTFMEMRESGEEYGQEGGQTLPSKIKHHVKHSADWNADGPGGLRARKERTTGVSLCKEEGTWREVLEVDSAEDSCKSMPGDNNFRRRSNGWGSWEGGVVSRQAGESDRVVVGEADSESDERMSQRSRFDSLREQLSQLEEVAALQNVKEVGAQVEIVRLRETNGRLVAQMAVMRESVSRLESEKRSLNSRLGALKNAMQQLEREALIRSGVQLDMAAATYPQPSQGWLSWGTKDKMAEASSIAEEARVQNAAATVMVEKLLHENAELADQLNDQSGLLERLARTYGNLANLPVWDGRQIETPPIGQGGSTNDGREKTTEIEAAELQGGAESLRAPAPPLLSTPSEEVRRTMGEDMVASAGGALRDHHSLSMPSHLPSDIKSTRNVRSVSFPHPPMHSTPVGGLPYSPRSGPEGVRIGVVTTPQKTNRSRSVWLDSHLAESGRQQCAQSGRSSYGSLESWNTDAFPSSPKVKKGLRDAPVLAAPFRLVQMLARYVSGADLVEQHVGV